MVTSDPAACYCEKIGVGEMRVVPARDVLLVAFAGIAVIATWVGFLQRWMDSISPGGETLASCLARMPESPHAGVFSQDGKEYLVLAGEMQSFPRFPSGPPLYIFDRTGRLVDWVPDSGDADDWWQKWPGLRGKKEISQQQLARWPRGE